MREPRSFHGRPKLFLLNSASPPERLLAERASRVRCSHQTALWFHAIGFQSGMLSKKCCVSALPHGYCRSRHRRPRLHGALTPPPRALAQTSRVSLVGVCPRGARQGPRAERVLLCTTRRWGGGPPLLMQQSLRRALSYILLHSDFLPYFLKMRLPRKMMFAENT